MKRRLSIFSFIPVYLGSWRRLVIHSLMLMTIVALAIVAMVVGWHLAVSQPTQATVLASPSDQLSMRPVSKPGKLSQWLLRTSLGLTAQTQAKINLPKVTVNLTGVRVPILMYHYIRVNPDPNDVIGYGLSVTPADFTQQMAYLAANGYQAISVAQVRQSIRNGMALPERPVVITFDDGYRDFYTDAYPILQQYGLHGETYVITSLVGDDRYVTWSMLRQMIKSGVVTVGSHTVDHPHLTTLSATDQLKELVQSKHILESTLGITVDDFCYPFGNYDQQVAQAVAQAGYADATTTKMGVYRVGEDVMALPRVRVEGGESLNTFIDRLKSLE